MKGDQACARRACGDWWAMLGALQAGHPSGMILLGHHRPSLAHIVIFLDVHSPPTRICVIRTNREEGMVLCTALIP